ncbi:MAG: hypothetical protein JWN37_384 [Candidatus Nomurabacteria bacterium]|nr:hypothetical protein [Candidatus Nomurabacteria bacterium]
MEWYNMVFVSIVCTLLIAGGGGRWWYKNKWLPKHEADINLKLAASNTLGMIEGQNRAKGTSITLEPDADLIGLKKGVLTQKISNAFPLPDGATRYWLVQEDHPTVYRSVIPTEGMEMPDSEFLYFVNGDGCKNAVLGVTDEVRAAIQRVKAALEAHMSAIYYYGPMTTAGYAEKVTLTRKKNARPPKAKFFYLVPGPEGETVHQYVSDPLNKDINNIADFEAKSGEQIVWDQ